MKTVGVLDDNIGIVISVLCIAHCGGVPLSRFIAPAFTSTFTQSDQTHIILAAFVLLFGFASITKTQLKHCNRQVKVLMVPGMFLVGAVTAGILMGMPEEIEVVSLIAGNVLVIAAHILNRKLIGAHNALTCIADDHTMPALSERYYA